eukprot:372850_1
MGDIKIMIDKNVVINMLSSVGEVNVASKILHANIGRGVVRQNKKLSIEKWRHFGGNPNDADFVEQLLTDEYDKFEISLNFHNKSEISSNLGDLDHVDIITYLIVFGFLHQANIFERNIIFLCLLCYYDGDNCIKYTCSNYNASGSWKSNACHITTYDNWTWSWESGHENEILLAQYKIQKLYIWCDSTFGAKIAMSKSSWEQFACNTFLKFYKNQETNKIRLICRESVTNRIRVNQWIPKDTRSLKLCKRKKTGLFWIGSSDKIFVARFEDERTRNAAWYAFRAIHLQMKAN